jgi:hypothetical protein
MWEYNEAEQSLELVMIGHAFMDFTDPNLVDDSFAYAAEGFEAQGLIPPTFYYSPPFGVPPIPEPPDARAGAREPSLVMQKAFQVAYKIPIDYEALFEDPEDTCPRGGAHEAETIQCLVQAAKTMTQSHDTGNSSSPFFVGGFSVFQTAQTMWSDIFLLI